MPRNWRIAGWPKFRYDAATIAPFEQRFLLSSDEIVGAVEMMVDVYSTWAEPLAQETLFRLHGMLLSHDRQLQTISAYRRHADAVQIVSGRFDRVCISRRCRPGRFRARWTATCGGSTGQHLAPQTRFPL